MRGMKEFRKALDRHMRGVRGMPQELRGPERGSSIDIELMKCSCGRYHCVICDPHSPFGELKAAVLAEIERRKKLKQD
jgi:hypothetical protein